MASLLFIPWQHPQVGAMLPLLIPGWTLNYEMAFYVMFAASLALPKSIRLWALLALLAGAGGDRPGDAAATASWPSTPIRSFSNLRQAC